MAVDMKGVSFSGGNQCQMEPLHALVHPCPLVNHDCLAPLTSPQLPLAQKTHYATKVTGVWKTWQYSMHKKGKMWRLKVWRLEKLNRCHLQFFFFFLFLYVYFSAGLQFSNRIKKKKKKKTHPDGGHSYTNKLNGLSTMSSEPLPR